LQAGNKEFERFLFSWLSPSFVSHRSKEGRGEKSERGKRGGGRRRVEGKGGEEVIDRRIPTCDMSREVLYREISADP